jgi:DNA repair exonuclease SbcCD nuclease subunit
MAKVLLFTDLHIHNHKQSLQRLQDCLDVLRWAFQTARDREIKDVLFLGDLFHDRQKIQVMAYHNTFQVFEEYRDLNIYLLLGNHDLWFHDKWDISSVMPLSAMSNVQVIAKPCTMEIAGGLFDFLPFTHDPISVVTEHFKNKSPVLCGHVAIDDATLNEIYSTKSEVSIESEKDMVRVNKDVFKGWEKVLLGHYHCPQQLNDRIEYIGSPLQLSFGEAFQSKHLMVMDAETLEVDYVENTFSPKYLIIRDDEVGSAKLENNFVQVQVDDVDSVDVMELRKYILDNYRVQSIDFKELKKQDIKANHQELQEKFDISNGDVLERYIATIGIDGLDYNMLLNIGKDICNED